MRDGPLDEGVEVLTRDTAEVVVGHEAAVVEDRPQQRAFAIDVVARATSASVRSWSSYAVSSSSGVTAATLGGGRTGAR